jgi:L-lysine 2,3-aminomutase
MISRAISFAEFKEMSYYGLLSEDIREELEVVTKVFPFKTNRYVVDSLIDWENIPQDPIFKINFPNRQMLPEDEYDHLLQLIRNNSTGNNLPDFIDALRSKKASKDVYTSEQYIPILDNKPLYGLVHQFPNTLVAMVRSAKTCFAHCSYCWAWPVHIIKGNEWGYTDPDAPVKYCYQHGEITDIFFTGGDILHMTVPQLVKYISPFLAVDSIQSIRIATRSLSWWPHRFTNDIDASELLRFFEEIINRNKHLSLISHIGHPREISTPQAEAAIRKIHDTGAVVRCQTPLIKTVNDSVHTWISLLEKEIRLGLIPYYMFIDANTEAVGCFKVPLANAYHIYSESMKKSSGLAKTMHGPVIMHDCRKIEIVGAEEIHGKKQFILKCLQSPDPEQIGRIATIPYNPAIVDLSESTINFN